MAASDQTYRNQKTLDTVFGVSCLLMLIGIFAMFWQDYSRPWKKVQRQFRDVDEAITQRQLLTEIAGHLAVLDAAEEKAKAIGEARKQLQEATDKAGSDVHAKQADRDRLSSKAAELKANRDSIQSLYDIAVDERDHNPGRTDLQSAVNQRYLQLQQLNKDYDAANLAVLKAERDLVDARKPIVDAQDKVDKAEEELKKINDKKTGDATIASLDVLAKGLAQKGFRTGDWIRSLPVIDGFASPYKIRQTTLEELPIDYSFKRVTRYDRCTSCHLGMEQDKFTREALKKLGSTDVGPKLDADESQKILDRLRQVYDERKKNGESLGFDPSDLPKRLLTVQLNDAQVNQFAAHPRLELFVDGNSPHPVEKFGCTPCHSGQGSATDFQNASHTPNNAVQRKQWADEHDWELTHGGDWEYPMLANRFIESSCVKCHHEITDLVTHGSKEEAPKLLRGYNLVRESGCFGCHEIAGIKSGISIGPDLRLEPSVPLDSPYLSPAEREKLLSDPLNPPGTMRKVGPSLYRVSEKTNQDFIRKWVFSPRGFRPTTKMPHFYNTVNNNPADLSKAPDDETKRQAAFPNAEIAGIAYYLEVESRNYLTGKDLYRRMQGQRQKELEAQGNALSKTDKAELDSTPQKLASGTGSLAPSLALRIQPKPLIQTTPNLQLATKVTDGDGKEVDVPAEVAQKDRDAHLVEGARLFRERGCLACHRHSGAQKDFSDAKGPINGVKGEATFAPDLSRIAAKIGPELANATDAQKRQAQRLWLVQWILNPNVYHPRTRMPITHLDATQAAAVADWLLSQPVNDPEQKELQWPNDEAYAGVAAEPSLQVLADLARVSLIKAPGLTADDVDNTLKAKGDGRLAGIDPKKPIKWDADERELQKPEGITADDLKWYVGRKAIGRQGCFGCHDIPGFETSKPIGTALNDWGKKDPARLAFEDSVPFVEEHFHIVDQIRDEKGYGPKADGHKEPFEQYFFDALHHHEREGFLQLKLYEPRSYDYNRIRAWDDRLKMPQFKFARGTTIPLKGENLEQAENRTEAEARDAVMTFILGLVAEPIPAKYQYQPTQDKLAEIKGRKVLEKYNCIGCHEVQPGTYEFKVTPRSTDVVRRDLQDLREGNSKQYKKEHVFLNHNAWAAGPARSDRVVARGDHPRIETEDGKKRFAFLADEAISFKPARTWDGLEPADAPDVWAYDTVRLPRDQMILPPGTDEFLLKDGKLPATLMPYGGTFANLMLDYLDKRDHANYPIAGDDDSKPRSALPPPLQREGEKVLPAWLHDFLKEPTPLRPEGYMLLRMPKFNFSDEEIGELVHYFSGTNRVENPGINLAYPYQSIGERGEAYLRERNKEYVARLKAQPNGQKLLEDRVNELKPLWAQYVKERLQPEAEAQLADLQAQQTEAEKDPNLKSADAKTKEDATKRLDAIKQRIADTKKTADGLKDQVSKNDFPELRKQWEEEQVYATDAFRMMSDRNMCLTCHNVGHVTSEAPKAPPLALASMRVRPDWAERWIAAPSRMMPTTIMTALFPKEATPDKMDTSGGGRKTYFVGSPLEQVRAARDVLMNFQAVEQMPGNRTYRPPIVGGK